MGETRDPRKGKGGRKKGEKRCIAMRGIYSRRLELLMPDRREEEC